MGFISLALIVTALVAREPLIMVASGLFAIDYKIGCKKEA